MPVIKMNNNEMLLFCELMQNEYNEKENKADKQINIDDFLKVMAELEKQYNNKFKGGFNE